MKTTYKEHYRPQLHFSPKQHWINDPNGMVYFNHTYHLFYQYYPGGTVWGPMHWGHAESKDLIHWKQLPTALFPDSLGYIFSGSAVVDSNNTSGFGRDGKIPLVAIFTQHDEKGEKAGTDNFQNQSIAYSLDNGRSWTKYAGNPVLKNPGIRDFRDPKVMWYAPAKKWVMTLATKDDLTFYSSPDLKNWRRESSFGKGIGAHGGVWECPDLFPLKLKGKTYWVLLANLNPGGPNGGSATQYFIGQFDGSKFTPLDTETKWIDYGPDEYAGITWSNTGSRRIFLGWMNNWAYADKLPTKEWRGAMTLPRELKLMETDGKLLIASNVVPELGALKTGKVQAFNDITIHDKLEISAAAPPRFMLQMSCYELRGFEIELSNNAAERLVIGYDEKSRQYFIDRTRSGVTDFNPNFGARATAPRLTDVKGGDLKLIIDDTSAELFADNGLTVMTSLFFPTAPYTKIELKSDRNFKADMIKLTALSSIWK